MQGIVHALTDRYHEIVTCPSPTPAATEVLAAPQLVAPTSEITEAPTSGGTEAPTAGIAEVIASPASAPERNSKLSTAHEGITPFARELSIDLEYLRPHTRARPPDASGSASAHGQPARAGRRPLGGRFGVPTSACEALRARSPGARLVP
jgi:hypothetical protein